MAFTVTPNLISPCYRPVVFRWTATSTENVQRVLVKVYVYGQLVTSYYKIPVYSSGDDYTFDIDVHQVLIESSAPRTGHISSIFGNLGEYGVVNNSDVIGSFYIDVFLQYRSSVTGLLETIGEEEKETSDTFYFIPATRQSWESMHLDSYYDAIASPPWKVLSNAPDNRSIGLSEDAFVSILAKGIDICHVYLKLKDGSDQFAQWIINPAPENVSMLTIGVGTANLQGAFPFFTDVDGNGFLPLNFIDIVYYTVTFGKYTSGVPSSYVLLTEPIRFDVVHRCGYAKQLFWMNRLGGIDQFTFEGEQQLKQRSGGEIKRKRPEWSLVQAQRSFPYFKGNFKDSITSVLLWEITQNFDDPYPYWLRELKTASEVYLLQYEQYNNVTIENGETTLEDARKDGNDFNLTIQLEDETTQRY
ncbi:MAG: hypothetical protein HC874_14275 [Richelia sp. SL_2_1]|nr:hypothetical protein [Richelia sp. SL_2_1]